MTDKGIIFSAPMVQALLDGRKTQTRRLFKPKGYRFYTHPISGDHYESFNEDGVTGGGPMHSFGWGEHLYAYLSYAPGDRLYVREAWHVRGRYSDVVEVGYRASENRGHSEYVEQIPAEKAVPGKGKWPEFPNYGPSIHMPRWASRLWLLVTDVRVQRLQEISEEDAIAEGIEHSSAYEDVSPGWRNYLDPNWRYSLPSPKGSYATLWNSLHTAEGERWEDDPWICAVSFSVHNGNIDEVPA